MDKPIKKEKLGKRTTNFTKNEEQKLVRLVLQYKDILENKKTDAETSRRKDEIWETLAVEFNAASNSEFRSVKALREKYKNMKRNIRKSKADERRERFAINGEVDPLGKEEDTNSVIDEFCEVIGININGLNNRYDDEVEQILEEELEKLKTETDNENASIEHRLRLQHAATEHRLRVEHADREHRLRMEQDATEHRLRVAHANTEHRLRVECLQMQIKKLKEKKCF